MLSFWLTKGGRRRKEGTMPITRLQLKCCCLSWCIGLAIPGHRSVARHHHHGEAEEGVAGSPSPASRMGRRVKKGRELALQTISGTLKMSMSPERFHNVLFPKPGCERRRENGTLWELILSSMFSGLPLPKASCGPPPG